MIKFLLLPTLFLALFSCGQTTPAIDCEKTLDQEPVLMRVPAMQLKDSIQTDLDILSTCGQLDSIDRTILNDMLGIIAVKQMQEDIKITYRTLLDDINKFKQTQDYRDLRKQILNGSPKKQTTTSSSNFEFPELDDLPSALTAAKKANKKCLIYFSCYTCVNARKMEERVLTNPEIRKLIQENSVYFVANVDDQTKTKDGSTSVGEKNMKLQKETFKGLSQPMFFILDENGKKLSEIEYTNDSDEFIAFLKKGIN